MSYVYSPKHQQRIRQKLREGKTLRTKRQIRELPKSVKMKHTYRVRARDSKDWLTFFKTRTKDKTSTIRRFATLQGFKPDRITV